MDQTIVSYDRSRQILTLLAAHGPLSVRGLTSLLEPPIRRRLARRCDDTRRQRTVSHDLLEKAGTSRLLHCRPPVDDVRRFRVDSSVGSVARDGPPGSVCRRPDIPAVSRPALFAKRTQSAASSVRRLPSRRARRPSFCRTRPCE